MSGRKRFSWDASPAGGDGGPSSSKKQKTDPNISSDLSVSELEPGMIRGRPLVIRVTHATEPYLSSSGKTWVHNFNGIGRDMKEISFASFGDNAKAMGRQIKEDNIYSFTTFEVKKSPDVYQKCDNPFEISLKPFTVVEDKDVDFPSIPFDIKTLSEAVMKPEGETVDILGVIVEDLGMEVVGPKSAKKRELVITDKDKQLVSMVLWGKIAEDWSVDEFAILMVRKALVSSYSGETNLQYSSKTGTYIKVNPSTSEAADLRNWFDVENQKRVQTQATP